jgi:hypothetical protein
MAAITLRNDPAAQVLTVEQLSESIFDLALTTDDRLDQYKQGGKSGQANGGNVHGVTFFAEELEGGKYRNIVLAVWAARTTGSSSAAKGRPQ